MTRKKVIKILIIVSVIILLLGIIMGIGMSKAIINIIPTEEVIIDGTNIQGIIDLLGNIGSKIIGLAIVAGSIFIDITIWSFYGIIILIKEILNKLKENKDNI